MNPKLLKSRYRLLFAFIAFFMLSSFVVRTVLLCISLPKSNFTLYSILVIYGEGIIYDLGVAVFFTVAYSIYLLLLPQRWNNSLFNRAFTYTGTFLAILIIMFSFFAEFSFWHEFESRFNFIAVDYLIYTYEVISNINQSYPMPLLIGGMLLISILVFWLISRAKAFSVSFTSNTPFLYRLLLTGLIVAAAVFYGCMISNSWADKSTDRYRNELAKSGIYSFFAAYKNNELNYNRFYSLIDYKKALSIVRNELQEKGTVFTSDQRSIRREISGTGQEQKPNVIMITIESFSADFMQYFGNDRHLTPTLDSLALNSILFSNLYATGTRTVRGMEALSLSIPPTPGNSIVRRQDNANLLTVGNVFKQKGYERSFIYGGDGYFDNMDNYFGNNGFDILDHGKTLEKVQSFAAAHDMIPDSMVHFENAWGMSDEDLYDAVIMNADARYSAGKPFYDFVMTTSNHRPFTYPAGKIDIPSKSGRDGAVKYTDYAIAQLLKKAAAKPWFHNTVFIFVADHCASSAGKNEIDIAKYHIPCMIVNLQNVPNRVIDKMCSQIDIYPTLFNLLGWSYESSFFGKNVLDTSYSPRIVLGTYQKLAYMNADSLVILSPQQAVETYRYDKVSNEQIPVKLPRSVIDRAIANYQAAYSLYKNGALKQ